MEFVAQQIDHSDVNKYIEQKATEDDMVVGRVLNTQNESKEEKNNGEITTCYSLQIPNLTRSYSLHRESCLGNALIFNWDSNRR